MLSNVNKNSKEKFLAGDSELSERIHSLDWSTTPLGPLEAWPQSLKTSVNLILNSRHPMWIGWGPEATFLYNDAYIQVLSLAKHPWALGRPAAEVWAEIWDVCGPLADKVFNAGIASYVEDVQLFMSRGDYFEETYYSFSYSPIYDESGKVAGLFCPSAETTAKVLHARRLKTLSELASNALVERTIRGACESAFETLRKNTEDIPFAALYLVDNETKTAHLEQTSGLPAGSDLTPAMISLKEQSAGVLWPMIKVSKSRAPVQVSVAGQDLPVFSSGHKVTDAIVLPVIAGQDMTIGILIAAVNPCRKADADYQTFYDLLANQIAIAIQNARSAEDERRRLEMLAEIDKAKTAFFSNVSHEFRTPLTLMLGPLEEILNKDAHQLPEDARRGLESTHRNAMRLFRLVNTLLDFSRIEAGRLAADFTPVNLAAFTTDLASSFRSVIESAKLKFVVECQEIDQPVHVDPDMWEKIVFNLLSNAFKFTLHGQIAIRLYRIGEQVILEVADSGIGIPPEEMPHLFERFHRVKKSAGRTFEGTGIGLSLVKELVSMHKGSIEAHSTVGKGTRFLITLPVGKKHLKGLDPTPGVMPRKEKSSMAEIYVKELESLMGGRIVPPGFHTGKNDGVSVAEGRKKVLVVDDNADMRQYITRLLVSVYEVAEAENGSVALAKVEIFKPDIVISDIMMPVMDGIQFLNTIKKIPAHGHIPVILLSARAGEEARIEGYELGADDYLVKPFSVNELHARVKAQIKIAQVRRNAEMHLRNFFHQAPVIIVVFRGPEFIVEIANEKLLQYWGKTLEQTLNKPLLEVLPEIINQGLVELLTNVLTTGQRRIENEREVPLMRNGKKEITYVSYVYEPLRNDEGQLTHVMVLANDVTESVLARKRIEASERKFRNLVAQAPVGIVILKGKSFVVDTANASYLQIANRKPEEFIGRNFFDALPELHNTPLLGLLNTVLDTGEPYFGSEFPVDLYRDGLPARAYFNFVYQPLIEDEGVKGIIAVVTEVTEIVKARKAAEDLANELEQRVEARTSELSRSNEKLEASNRELEQFAYIASHDLQEPLRKIQTFSELVKNNLNEADLAQRYISKIDNSASRMSLLIRDVLNYSKLSREGLPFQPVDLNMVVDNVKTDLELIIQETGAVIHHDNLPVVSGILLQLNQLLSNLISNSLKFSKRSPEIHISSKQVSAFEAGLNLPNDRTYTRLTVADNGIGFEQQYAEKIFVIFQRLHSHNSTHRGTGIGLALCKKIAENHGGAIEAKGELDKGAVFNVYLPNEKR